MHLCGFLRDSVIANAVKQSIESTKIPAIPQNLATLKIKMDCHEATPLAMTRLGESPRIENYLANDEQWHGFHAN